ncbi:12736_t:CDS:2 [Rhizophagus irregularis]|nr:12736_t:CDS:2 [Rhizophagus irregularis]
MACSSFSSNQVVYQLDPPQCALFLYTTLLKVENAIGRKQTISKRMKSRKVFKYPDDEANNSEE